MVQTRIVILSGHSLFAEGIASRLQQDTNRVEVISIDFDQGNYLAQIAEIQPSTVFIDSQDAQATKCSLLCELLIAFPDLTLVRLTVDQKDVQVITSQKQCFEEVQDLIEILLPPETSSN